MSRRRCYIVRTSPELLLGQYKNLLRQDKVPPISIQERAMLEELSPLDQEEALKRFLRANGHEPCTGFTFAQVRR